MPPAVEIRRGLVSVMMPVHNVEDYVGAAVESLLAQTYTNWELVVVDDGSTDGTTEVLARFKDPRIGVYRQASLGESAGRNRALQAMRGEWIAFLDGDDQFLPEHLAAAVDRLQHSPSIGGVYSDGFYMDKDGRRGDRLSSRRRGPFEGDLFDPLVRASDVFGPPICTVLRRQVVLDQRLTFDSRIVIGPDWDFLTGFAEVAQFGYLPQSTCLYRVHGESITARTASPRRRSSLAQCRQNAIQRPGFRRCSLETRTYAFYDLLLNLLPEDNRRRAEVTGWPQFLELPAAERGRLLRLMAAQDLLAGRYDGQTLDWLRRAVELAPGETRNRLLFRLCQVSPRLGQWVLRLRANGGHSAPAN